MHFNGRFVLNLARMASRQGADFNSLLNKTGRTADELGKPDCRLTVDEYNAFFDLLIEQTGDDNFGLHAGEELNLSAAGLIVQITQSSETIKEALQYCCEFSNLGCSALPATLEERERAFYLVFTPDHLWLSHSPECVKHTVYGYIAFMNRQFRSLTRNQRAPREIWLTTTKPNDTSEIERIMGCPVLYGKPENALVMEKSHLSESIVTSDYHLLQVLVAHAHEKIARLEKSASFYESVKHSVVNLVKPDFPTIEQVAAHLNMSVRTFQRRLSEEGHSYKKLIDELREDFAIGYLKRADLSINDIAYLLSYADASAFTRSFKRWTGKSPGEYRRVLETRT